MTKNRSPWLKWLLVAALAVALALGVVRALGKRKAQQAQAQAAAQALQQPPVFQLAARDVQTLQAQRLLQVVNVSGSIKALQSALIKAKTPGEITGLGKREGDAVVTGEVLARIDSAEAAARVRQAEQQAAGAQSQVGIAQRTQDNNLSLVQKGFISPTALETSSANLAAAKANHEAALAALDIARKALGDTVLRSPLTGQISARWVQNGERVGVDARIFEVLDLSAFELEAALAPADAAAIKTGQKAQLTVEGLGAPVEAEVVRINPNVQAGSRSVLVYLRLPTTPGLRQGLFAQGRIQMGELEGLALPLSSVRNDKPQPYVQLIREGRIVHTTVSLNQQGLQEGEAMFLVDSAASGLKAGDRVLRVQAGAIREGTAVVMAASAAPAPN
jgi:membrane fusion protein, multidrug efflux system